ncbi:hypothetical protein [Oceanisphaera sp.]|uniref:hypothetical protein n=1 Tax=Oceanisphaera sp. TaxID=1929979 RepID=UPI003A8CD018
MTAYWVLAPIGVDCSASVAPGEILEQGDVPVFTGEVEKVQALQCFPGLQLFGTQADRLLAYNPVPGGCPF